MESLSHDDLIEAGRRWLLKRRTVRGERRRGGCSLVLTEIVTATSETPDVIGWYGRTSIVLEAKTSRADFLADRKKSFRRYPEEGMGFLRYYIVPRDLVIAEEVPDGWGLIEVFRNRTRVVRESRTFQSRRDNEVAVLLSLIRRFNVEPGKHVSIRVYTIQAGEPRATAGIEPEEESDNSDGESRTVHRYADDVRKDLERIEDEKLLACLQPKTETDDAALDRTAAWNAERKERDRELQPATPTDDAAQERKPKPESPTDDDAPKRKKPEHDNPK